ERAGRDAAAARYDRVSTPVVPIRARDRRNIGAQWWFSPAAARPCRFRRVVSAARGADAGHASKHAVELGRVLINAGIGRRSAPGESGSRSGKLRLRRLSKFLQGRARWREERCAGVRGREIEQPVVSARRVADIHSLQHLLDHPKISRIADKIRTELPLPRTTKRHVVAQYIIFVAARIYDGRQ